MDVNQGEKGTPTASVESKPGNDTSRWKKGTGGTETPIEDLLRDQNELLPPAVEPTEKP